MTDSDDPTNIIQFPKPLDVLAVELRDAFDRCIAARELWIDRTIELAIKLKEAREYFVADRDFGQWLFDNDLYRNISDNDRAALLTMVSEPDIFRGVLIEQGDQVAADTVYRKFKERFGKLPKPAPLPESKPELATVPEQTPEIPAIEKQEPAESERKTNPTRVPALLKLPYARAELVAKYYFNKRTISYLGTLFPKRRSARFAEMWELLIYSIESGAFGPPTDKIVAEPNARLILPWISAAEANRLRLDLSKTSDQELARKFLLPAVLENLETLRANPPAIVQLYRAAVNRPNQERIAELHKQQRDKAIASLPAEPTPEGFRERPVVVYGTTLWPTGGTSYNFDELCLACWYCQIAFNVYGTSSPPMGQAMTIAGMMKFTPRAAAGWAAAVKAYGSAYSLNPNGVCDIPPPPVNFRITKGV